MRNAPAWIAAIAASFAIVISIIALCYSNYYASQSAVAARDAANATLSELRVEESPVLTERCFEGGSTSNLDAGVQIYPNARYPMYPDMLVSSAAEFSKNVGTYVTCTIHNYGRLPAIRVQFEYGFSYCSGVNVMKTDSLELRAIAPGAEATVAIVNGSNLSPMTAVPLRQTSFITPPDNTLRPYTFLGDILEYYGLQATPTNKIGKGSEGAATLPSQSYCAQISHQNNRRWVSWYHQALQHVAVGQRYVFRPWSNPYIPIGFVAFDNHCPTTNVGLSSEIPKRPPVRIYTPKTMEIVAISQDKSVTTLRGPTGLICIATSMLIPPMPTAK